MTPETVTTIGQQALWVTMLISAPLLLSALAVGLLVGHVSGRNADQRNDDELHSEASRVGGGARCGGPLDAKRHRRLHAAAHGADTLSDFLVQYTH